MKATSSEQINVKYFLVPHETVQDPSSCEILVPVTNVHLTYGLAILYLVNFAENESYYLCLYSVLPWFCVLNVSVSVDVKTCLSYILQKGYV